MNNQNKDKLLKDITLALDFDELPAEQQKEISSYIKFIKNKEKPKQPYPAEAE